MGDGLVSGFNEKYKARQVVLIVSRPSTEIQLNIRGLLIFM